MDVTHDSRWYARRALVAYLVTIAITRGITTVLHLRGAGADGGVIIDGIHIHHMVFGLTILVILTFGAPRGMADVPRRGGVDLERLRASGRGAEGCGSASRR